MTAPNIWLIRARGCLVPRGGGGAPRVLPAPGDGWLTLVGLSQRCSWVHSPPASQPCNLSLTRNDLITVTRLSRRTRSARLGGEACSASSQANLSGCDLFANQQGLIVAWSHVPISPLPLLAGWLRTTYLTSLSINLVCSERGRIIPVPSRICHEIQNRNLWGKGCGNCEVFYKHITYFEGEDMDGRGSWVVSELLFFSEGGFKTSLLKGNQMEGGGGGLPLTRDWEAVSTNQ